MFDDPAASSVIRWLQGRCRPDPEFSAGRVLSIYFDTPDADLLDEKANSDYLKTKVRLRWYANLADGAAGDKVFLEVKRREGGTRDKARWRVDFPGRELLRSGLDSPALLRVNHILHAAGCHPGGCLEPVLCVSYARHRFIDPPTGCRLSVDNDIRVPAVNCRRASRASPAPLPDAVFEMKGSLADLPAHLRPLVALGVRRGSFSKYLAAYEWTLRGWRG